MVIDRNIFDFDIVPSASNDLLESAYAALSAVQQYQEDWLEHGVDRVHLYFEDVEGDWLENFDAITVDDSLADSKIAVTFADISKQLKALGLSKFFIKNVAFPSWWIREKKAD